MSAAQALAWLRQRRESREDRVTVLPINQLHGWNVNVATGDLAHDSGRFFSIKGLRICQQDTEEPLWEQPIINQPEVGIVG
ncbi:MAG: NDP-hexose 2,3-dehydratase family protein, partial [Coriobacteriia bacterium]|nr:NDP-hexose 2,3-dehydratase family protein [Coriobacteriia bacterium]